MGIEAAPAGLASALNTRSVCRPWTAGIVLVVAIPAGVATARSPGFLVAALGAALIAGLLTRVRWFMYLIPALLLVVAPQLPISGIPRIVGAVMFLYWLVGLASGQLMHQRRATLALGSFAGLLLVSLGVSSDVPGVDRSNELGYVVIAIGVGIVASSARLRIEQLLRALALAGALAVPVLLVSGTTTLGRLEGLGNNPNGLGAGLAICVVAAIASARRRWFLPMGACAVAVGSLVFATGSQGSVVAGIAGLVVVLAHTARTSRRSRLLLLTVAVAVVLIGAVIVRDAAGMLPGRVQAEVTLGRSLRITYAHVAIDTMLDAPALGAGYGHFPLVAASDPRVGYLSSAHSAFLRVGAETGVLGLLLLLALAAVALRRYWMTPTAGGGGAAGVLVTILTANLFGDFLATWAVAVPLWMLVGTALADARRGDAPSVRVQHQVADTMIESAQS